uniref:Uncharacterized protein n=1 Tax=Vitis vinifera TaxID=29760 RepID=A5B8M3_VITVI|nr:hypothetical protein VITISV_036075 [Vitis vinifera]
MLSLKRHIVWGYAGSAARHKCLFGFRTPTRHVAHYPIRTASRKGKRRFIFSYPRKSKRRWQSVHIRIASTTHPDNQHEPSGYKSSGWSIKNEKTRGSDSKSLPTIILHNRFPRSLTAASPTIVSDSHS